MAASSKSGGRDGAQGTPEAQEADRMQRPLRVLIVATLVFPLIIFTAASVINYRAHFEDAIDRLQRTLGHVREHAAKVFESLDVTSIYVDELVSDASNEKIKADEELYHERLKRLLTILPELRDIWVIDAEGHPLVSASIYPVDRSISVSDRPFFAPLKEGKADSVMSGLIQSRAAKRNVVVIGRRRASPGGSKAFNGITSIAVAPEYFSDYYANLPGNTPDNTIGIIQRSGTVIAWYPTGRAQQLAPTSQLMKAIGESDQGVVTSVSPVDHVERIFAFSRLSRGDIYVLSGIDTSSIIFGWLQAMSYHLIFGIPATLGLALLSWLALRRVRRESSAYAQLRGEVMRRETTERALRQAQKLEAVGRLTGGIAHDFNNLLTAIMGNVDLAMRRLKTDDERISRSLVAIKEASARSASLVQRLLAFSRQHPHEVRVLDVNRSVRGMSDLLQRTIGESVTIETVLAAGLWKAALDANELENAILNLAINARDAMPGGGRLTIETANTYLDEDYATKEGDGVKPGQYLMLALTDAGTGMTREVMENVFEPFFTTKAKGVGSGLGLSMVYGFVKQSNGHIKIYSELGEGTTIKMYFPRSADQHAAPDPVARERREAVPASNGNETILLVEDDETVNRFGCEVLAELGYNVVSAHDGNDALLKFERHPEINMLFTDVILPGGMNGRQLATEIEMRRKSIKVLFATGYTRNAIVHHGRLDPGVEVLMKPYSYEALATKIRAILDAPEKS